MTRNNRPLGLNNKFFSADATPISTPRSRFQYSKGELPKKAIVTFDTSKILELNQSSDKDMRTYNESSSPAIMSGATSPEIGLSPNTMRRSFVKARHSMIVT